MGDGAIKPNLLNVRNKLEDGVKEKLERVYGVRITRDALTVSCNIARRCFDDEGKSLESREALLQSKAADLLEKACGTLRLRLDVGEVDDDEKSLDADEYKLVRSCVEIHEIRKEKDPDREAWLLHLHQELRDSMDKWDCYFNKWKPFPKKQHKRSPEILVKEAQLLQGFLQELLSCLPNNGSLHSSIRTDRWNEMVRQLDVLVTLNSDGFDKKFLQFVTVGPKLIAKVASSETGFPASWLLHSSLKPPVDDLVTRLSRRQFGKRFPILTISHALSRAECPSPLGCVTRPIGSFLFLCGHRHDGPELAEALTEELFEGKGSLIHFDLSKYTEPDSVSRLLGVQTSQGELGSSGELTDALEKNPFSIVLFSNIDAASVSVVDMVTEISRCGRLTNSQGKTIDFTKTLIIMTSTIEVDKEVSFACDCFRMVEECPIKELLNLHPEESKHRCSTFSRLEKVQKQFGHKLFEQLDDIVVFSSLGFQNAKAIARLQLREIASSMTPKGLIIYPSEALLTEILWMAFWWQGGEKLVKVWLEENLVPVLQLMCGKGEIKDNYIIYIDTLVGTQELSYRLVKLEDFFEEEALKQVKKKSAELRVLCRKQKARINRIYWLKRKLYALNPTTSVDTRTDFKFVDGAIRELVDIITLMINETDANLVGDKEKVVQRGMKEEVDLRLGDGGRKRAKKGVESLKAHLHNGLWGQATNIVAKAAKMIMDAPHYPPSLPVSAFLFLGLTTSSKEKIIGDLAENFVADDGAKLLLTIDLSEYTDSNSLSRLTDALSGYTVCEYCKGELFPEGVRMRPCSILFLDQVEKAHMSVFTALLSVLDRSMFIDHRGRTVGFRDTIVVISSNAGNKGIFSRLVGHASQNILDSDTKQEVKGFRFELLNRVGEMVFLDPFASHDDQLRKFATLSMLSGPHLKGRTPSGFSRTFFTLFKPANDLEGDSVGDPPEEYNSEDILIRDLSKKLHLYDGSSSSLCSDLLVLKNY